MNITKRIKELSEFLNCDKDEISVSTYDENLFEYGNQEYLVLTDTEADDYAENYIKDTLGHSMPNLLLMNAALTLNAQIPSALCRKNAANRVILLFAP